MSITVNPAASDDPIIAEMIANGLIRAPEPALAAPEEIEDLDVPDTGDEEHDALLAELEAQDAAPAGAGVIEKLDTVAPEAADEIDDLDELLVEATPEEAEVHPSILEGLEEQLAAQAAREEVYAEQDSKVGIIERPASAPIAVMAKPKRVSAAKATAPKREARFGTATAGSYVAGVMGDAEIASLVDGLPKKVKEKAANLVDFLHKGRTLSVFTQVAVNIMKEEGKLSNERLVRAFTTEATKRGMAAGYSIGTARSQAGQQIALFGRLGLASNVGGALVPNAASPIWQKLAA